MKYLVNITVGVFLLFLSCSISKKKENSLEKSALITIEQLIVSPSYRFQIVNQKLLIYKIVYNESGSKLVKRQSISLNENQVNDIHKYIKALSNLKPVYRKPLLGGIVWNISFEVDGKEKHIHLENMLVPPVSKLFTYLNEIILKKKYKILLLRR